MTSAASTARASWSATSAWIRACASPGPARRPTATSPSRARSGPATRWWKRAGRAVRQPGPLHAFYQRIRARRGHSVAVVAAARKLACLFWCLLTREQDYAYAQPSLTRKKLRRLELTAGHRRYTPEAAGIWHTNDAVHQAERALARQAEIAYARSVRDWHAAQATKGPSATPGRASQGRQSGKQRGRASVPDPAL